MNRTRILAPAGRVRRPAIAIAIGLLTTALVAQAAQTSGLLQWRSGAVATEKQAPEAIAAAVDGSLRSGARHVLVQFDEAVTPSQKAALNDAGIQLLEYIHDNAFFAVIDESGADPQGLAAMQSVRCLLPIDRDWKMHPDFISGQVPPWAVQAVKKEQLNATRTTAETVVAAYVMFHRGVDLKSDAAETIHRHGGVVRSTVESINTLVVEMPLDNVDFLADEDTVKWIEPPLPPLEPTNDDNRLRTGAELAWAPPYNLSGAGVTVLVYDAGTVDASHSDFGGRVTVRDSSGTNYHATHVAGTVGGDGTSSGGTHAGMAPGVTIESYGFEQEGGLQQGFLYTDPGDIEDDYSEAILSYGVDISNNSIGTNTASNGYPCDWEGNYGATGILIDTIVRGDGTNPLFTQPFRIVWANGNERSSGRCGTTYLTTAPPACAKNHITVGALNSNDDSVTDFTSWGPTDDGRLKPDISAPGCQSDGDNGVTSTDSGGGYTTLCGTSMASPTVCGLSALILEDYRQQWPELPDPRNSTLKCFFAHTAEDIDNVGPDFKSGYGSVRVVPAIDLVRSGNFFEAEVNQGETYSAVVIVDPGQTLKVTLAWDDVPGVANAIPLLVNDLDLEVYDASNNQYFPWTLDPANPDAPAVRTQADHRNNIEQVVIDNPTPGAYRIEVVGYNVAVGPQTFSLTATPFLVNCSSQGTVSLDRSKYACESAATLKVVDCDLNTDDAIIDTVTVNVASDSEPAGENIVLSETQEESAAFLNTIAISTTDAVGTLLVAPGDTITVTYIDADDGAGQTNVTVTDTAIVDCAPPVVSAVVVDPVNPRDATVNFSTDENATASIAYGISCDNLDGLAEPAGARTEHAVPVTGLEDNTTYFFAITVTDEAGNATTVDNGGACYTFTTPEIPDFFTEEFGGDHDLDNTTLYFTPAPGTYDQYTACIETNVTEFPTPAGGSQVSLSDDDSVEVSLNGNTFSFYGTDYTSAFVGSNGYITFGSGDTDYSESLADHFGQPRIAALFDDLNPSTGGTVYAEVLGDRAVFTWVGVPEYSSSNSNNFQIELFYSGEITVTSLGIDSADSIVGLSAGTGLSPDFYETPLSDAGSCGPRPPVASSQQVTVNVDTPQTIELIATDDACDGPECMDFVITTLPGFGTLSDDGTDITAAPHTLVGNVVTYTPQPGYFGADNFSFLADDGGVPPDGGPSNEATVTLSVEFAPPSILVETMPEGCLGQNYVYQMEAIGGQPTLNWSLIPGGDYLEDDLGTSYFFLTGDAQGWNADDGDWDYSLPFDFPFYGQTYSTATISSNGWINFGPVVGSSYSNSVELLKQNIRITPLWDDLRTDEGGDVFIAFRTGQITFRWEAVRYGSSDAINIAVTLFDDGRIQFHYGSGNNNLTPTVGISNGDETSFLISQYNDASSLTGANSVEIYAPAPMPEGLMLDADGLLHGTPTETGNFRPQIRVEDALGRADQVVMSLDIVADCPFAPGDLNCDGAVDFGDINPFVTALSGQAGYEDAYPSCQWLLADLNGDGTVDFDDINPFVAALSGS